MEKRGGNFLSIKLLFKLFLRRFKCIPSFCKNCGCKVEDFVVEDELWSLIENNIPHGNVLCFNCFSRLIKEKTNITAFKLEKIE